MRAMLAARICASLIFCAKINGEKDVCVKDVCAKEDEQKSR